MIARRETVQLVERGTSGREHPEFQLVVAALDEDGNPSALNARMVCTCGAVLDEYPLEVEPGTDIVGEREELHERAQASFEALVFASPVTCPVCGMRWRRLR